MFSANLQPCAAASLILLLLLYCQNVTQKYKIVVVSCQPEAYLMAPHSPQLGVSFPCDPPAILLILFIPIHVSDCYKVLQSHLTIHITL